MTHAAFLLASGNVRATMGKSKLKRVTANQKWRAPRDENLRSENIEPEKSSYPVSIRSSALAGVSVIQPSWDRSFGR
jgi:hypothetical protein